MGVNYFVCPCLFDIVSSAVTSNYEQINKFLSVNFLIIEYDGSFYLCCKDSIEFYYDCCKKQSDIYETCSSDLTELISCLDLICYGFEDLCPKCEKFILKYFLEHLTKIEK